MKKISDRDWHTAVVAEMKGVATDEQVAALRADIPRWHRQLTVTLADVQHQLDVAGPGADGDWRSRADGFAKYVRRKLDEVEVLRDDRLWRLETACREALAHLMPAPGKSDPDDQAAAEVLMRAVRS